MNNQKLSIKWLYIFISIAIVALATGLSALYFKEHLIAGCMGVILVAQILNIIKWKKQ